ncbi:hypothetical protein GGI03_000389 [Coemansia sp. RSA 2337]|nr:hypothetical protein GGI14_000217 [Coemansia sp. S680]KAJ2041867.1 hypothetical protein H4S03_000041 [Coemansia sp. S3946]KAJ2066389.1 hypothetical protein GGI08_001897 [Coemansia sp. S2]KAJ2076129.1 hypothetical protein GGH13_000114 [Coemansia sp. S155-1]KAJ2354354.1 hypothetical protein GGH92_000085 [Coemansia sp. RSA 2673]KAJ2428199.1 hypothetical protein GGF41_001444 [Coemansia sp. RSA 2531]KAJ2469408.1 hypothetical protein GGI03_000389 [Coemansia sp. RSA 2337]
MLNSNELPVVVLAQILHKVTATPAKSLSEWKTKLPLVAVCRTWAVLTVDAVFNQVYVEPVRSQDFLWTSNAELLISRECVSVARRLTLGWSYCTTPDHLQYIVVEILKMGRVDWSRINSLTITLADWTLYRRQYRPTHYEHTSTDNTGIVQYFAQNLRNVVELDLLYRRYGDIERYIFDSLASYYDRQLQVLRAPGQILMPISCIASNIRVLELTLDSSAAPILPSICGKTLKVLTLFEVPRNFAWHYFRYDISDRPIVFLQLTALRLVFNREEIELTEGEVKNKIVSGAHNCDQLVFPALRELSIDDCTPDCDLLYANLPFPELKEVRLSGDFTHIRHCSRLKLTWVGDLYIYVSSTHSRDSADFYKATNHFFSNIRIGQTAALVIFCEQFIPDPELMRWPNLTTLQLDSIGYTRVCKVIGQLPSIRELTIYCLEFIDMAGDSLSANSSLFINADPMVTWATNLTRLVISRFNKSCPLAVGVGGIQALILHAGALSELVVPKLAEDPVDEFIETHKHRYAHLADIDLFGSDY